MSIPAPGAPRVLIADDEHANRDLLTRLLRAQGWNVETASDGAEALRAIARRPPDLVVSDVLMPGGPDGFEVVRTLKSAPETRLIPIVLITGLSDREQRIQGIEAGADDFLGKPFDPQELTARVRSLLKLKHYTDELESAESVIMSLALTVEARDAYTNGHCRRLASFSVALGQSLGLSDEELQALRRGAYLHDVGKIAIPDAILRKPGPLDAVETTVIREHPVIGEQLCGSLKSLRLVRSIVRHHHERRDGSGYPDKLAGDAIPVLAEIVAIADTFDAIITPRPYRAARDVETAFTELMDGVASGLWRPGFVETFIAIARTGALAVADEPIP